MDNFEENWHLCHTESPYQCTLLYFSVPVSVFISQGCFVIFCGQSLVHFLINVFLGLLQVLLSTENRTPSPLICLVLVPSYSIATRLLIIPVPDLQTYTQSKRPFSLSTNIQAQPESRWSWLKTNQNLFQLYFNQTSKG